MQLQHINVKLLVKNPAEVDLEPLVPVFHGWIQEQGLEELLLDVADYRHVHAGPGVVLIGHQANYSVDNTDERLGIRYNRKAALNGSNDDALRQAMRARRRMAVSRAPSVMTRSPPAANPCPAGSPKVGWQSAGVKPQYKATNVSRAIRCCLAMGPQYS